MGALQCHSPFTLRHLRFRFAQKISTHETQGARGALAAGGYDLLSRSRRVKEKTLGFTPRPRGKKNDWDVKTVSA
jgi:hypothetical protein